MDLHPRIAALLVETGAYQDLTVPVILTSGNLGIYYVNAEKLAQDGGQFNEFGDSALNMHNHALRMTEEHPTFGEVIDIMADFIRRDVTFRLLPRGVGLDSVAISGGQRRDWLFSAPIAQRLDRPHIALYKDGRAEHIPTAGYIPNVGDEITTLHPHQLTGVQAIHVADLLTIGSSCYDSRRSPPTGWVPMLRGLGATSDRLFAAVSRLQRGEETLATTGVQAEAFVPVGLEFLLDHSTQPEVAAAYFRDPKGWSESYLREQGIEPFVSSFDPAKGKLDRAGKFLGVYEHVLREFGRWAELERGVQERYKVDINTIPKLVSAEE